MRASKPWMARLATRRRASQRPAPLGPFSLGERAQAASSLSSPLASSRSRVSNPSVNQPDRP